MLYLELARRQKGWSQGALANHPKVRIDRYFISMIERGLALPVPAQAERLARALGVPVEMLLQTVPNVEKDLPAPEEEQPAVNG